MKNKKGMVIGLAVVLILILVVILIVVNITNKQEESNVDNKVEEKIEKLSDGTEKNSNDNFTKTKRFKDYEISNIIFTAKDNLTKFTCDIKNISGRRIEEHSINIILKDKAGTNITKLTCYVSSLDNNQVDKLKTSSTLNFIHAYDYVVEEET